MADPLSPYIIMGLQATIQGMGSILLSYGVQAGLFIPAISVLARKHTKAARTLMASVSVLFISSTLGVATYVALMLLLLKDPGYAATSLHYGKTVQRLGIVHAVTARLNYIISDAIVVWRAWILWPGNRVVQGILVCAMIYSVVAVIANGILARFFVESPVPHIIVRSAMLVTNVLATVLVGIKLWIYRRQVNASMKVLSGSSRLGGILTLLLESGLAYSAVWILEISPLNKVEAYSMNFGALTFVIAGIYPTFIVLVVTLQQRATAKSMTGEPLDIPETLRFASHGHGLSSDQESISGMVSKSRYTNSYGIPEDEVSAQTARHGDLDAMPIPDGNEQEEYFHTIHAHDSRRSISENQDRA
ncbi:hypothetical protein HDZ31DRAFT_61573 [Schizophyllum fasciatum]